MILKPGMRICFEKVSKAGWVCMRRLSTSIIGLLCYDLITHVATLGLRLEDELGVRGRECIID